MTAYGKTKHNGIWALEPSVTSESVILILCDWTNDEVIRSVTFTREEFRRKDPLVMLSHFPLNCCAIGISTHMNLRDKSHRHKLKS
jgi:hypothetical protein